MATPRLEKPGFFLLFPWGLISIVIILLLGTFLNDWIGKNWNWLAIVLIVPAAILENLKVGYSSLRVMFLKILFTALSFLVVGLALGMYLAGWYYASYKNVQVERFNISWYVLLSIIVILLIQIVQVFSLLKAVKRELVQFDPDN